MVILFYLIVFFLLIYAFGPTKTLTNPKTCVKMHKWIWKNEGTEEEYLICAICNKRPQDTINEGVEL